NRVVKSGHRVFPGHRLDLLLVCRPQVRPNKSSVPPCGGHEIQHQSRTSVRNSAVHDAEVNQLGQCVLLIMSTRQSSACPRTRILARPSIGTLLTRLPSRRGGTRLNRISSPCRNTSRSIGPVSL